MNKWFKVAAFCICTTACSRPATYEFPIGLFGVGRLEDAVIIKGLGFNAAQPFAANESDLALLVQGLHREGVMPLVAVPPLGSFTRPASAFPGAVWYLFDEPDVHGVTRDQLMFIDRKTRDWAPNARTAFVVGDGRRGKDFSAVGDVIMVDWYPVPHLPLESAGDHVRLTAEAAQGRRVWAVLQAMDWRNFPQHDPKKPRIGRFPDKNEIRFMSYDAVLSGAQGLWYFVWTFAPGQTLAQYPEYVMALSAAAKEMREMADVFVSGRPIELPFAPEPDGLTARAWTRHGRDYVVLINRHKATMHKIPDVLLTSSWRTLFDVRRDPREALIESDGAYYLPPYAVLVLESRLKADRLLSLSGWSRG